MSALVDFELEQFSTETAPGGPLDGQEFTQMPAENNPEVFVVYKNEYIRDNGGYYRTRFIGAYWSGDTARAVANMFGAQWHCLEIGLIPVITPKDIH
jgi:hypothetical protein